MEKEMNKFDLAAEIEKSCTDTIRLFYEKNKDYGEDADAFANFRKSAQRLVMPFMANYGIEISEEKAMFLVMLILQDKHLVALSHTGIDGADVSERLQDIAVYSFIMKALSDNSVNLSQEKDEK